MWIPSWLRFWRPAASRPSSRRPQRHRPSLEQLEGRALPAAYTAASVADLIADINLANSNPANLTGESNTITLEAGTTFKLTAADNGTDGGNGLPVIAANDNLTIVGYGATIERANATGTPAFRLFDVAAGASLTLTDLTLQGGLTYSSGGAIYSQGGLNLTRVTVQNNLALGSHGGNSSDYFGGPGGDALGGGVYIGGGTALLNGVTLSGNTAQGGDGGDGGVGWLYDRHGNPWRYVAYPGGSGGVGYGGGLYAAGGTVTLLDTSVTGNTAQGGTGGRGGSERGLKGKNGLLTGQGVGGGLYLSSAALVSLDAFTLAHVKGNHASTSDHDIYGSYTTL
jgi:hypothetical protein